VTIGFWVPAIIFVRVGPSVVGWLEDLTGKTATGLYVVAALEMLGAVLILRFMPRAPVVAELSP
jgi:hypothetical protein